MATTKPIIKKINTLAADTDLVINFSYFGNQSEGNKVTIKEADSLKVVYADEDYVDTPTHRLQRIIPASETNLVNGNKYSVEIQCYEGKNPDGTKIESAVSDKMYFWVLATPIFDFDISDNYEVNMASIELYVNYYQENGEELYKYNFELQTSTNNIIYTSNDLYSVKNNPDKENWQMVSYIYKGLQDNTYYKVICKGVTTNGIEVYTERNIVVHYSIPKTYSKAYVECDPNTSIIHYSTNFKTILPIKNDYTYDNGYIDLQDDEIEYDNLDMSGDFTLSIKCKNLKKHTSDLINISNDKNNISLAWVHTGEDDNYKFRLRSFNGYESYILYSDTYSYNFDEIYIIHIRKQNNLFLLKVFTVQE